MIEILLQGDALQLPLETCSIDAIVTDPPYELGFMGKAWDRSGIANNIAVWNECRRVLKPGGHLLSFGGTRTYHRMASAIEDSGFEIRDQLQWIFGSGFPKSKNIGNGLGTALKPAHEPICLARKPLDTGSSVADNVARWGTGALNIDESRVFTDEALEGGATGKRTALMNMGGFNPRPNHSRAGEPSASRRYTGKGGTNFAATPGIPSNELSGRWPANVLHDGSDEVVDQFPIQTSGANPTRRNSDKFRGTYGAFAGQEECEPARGAESGSAARFFYCAKASQEERNFGGADNIHPTIKPIDLMKYLVRLITPPGGTVLDPFAGSGSTLIAAMICGFGYVGIEQSEEYVNIARARLAANWQRELLG